MSRSHSFSIYGKIPDQLLLPFREKVINLIGEVNKGILFEGSSPTFNCDISIVFEVEKEDELPDIIFLSGYRSIFSSEFKNRFRDNLVFKDTTGSYNQEFSSLQLKDPEGFYSILCLNPSVFVVDVNMAAKSGLPIPRTWMDLLNPVFEKKIEFRYHDHALLDSVLLQFHKNSGFEGVERFSNALLSVEQANTSIESFDNGENRAISIMPYSSARTLDKKYTVSIIWPADGAVITPIFTLVKKLQAGNYKSFINFLSGSYVGSICSTSYFPSLHPQIDSRLPSSAPLVWIGWEYLLSNDIDEVLREAYKRIS